MGLANVMEESTCHGQSNEFGYDQVGPAVMPYFNRDVSHATGVLHSSMRLIRVNDLESLGDGARASETRLVKVLELRLHKGCYV